MHDMREMQCYADDLLEVLKNNLKTINIDELDQAGRLDQWL